MILKNLLSFSFVMILFLSCANQTAEQSQNSTPINEEATAVLTKEEIPQEDLEKNEVETTEEIEKETEVVSINTTPILEPKEEIPLKKEEKKVLAQVDPLPVKETKKDSNDEINSKEEEPIPTEIEEKEETKEAVEHKKEIEPEISPNVDVVFEEPKILKANHQAWDALLRKHVTSTGKVNYAGFKSDISQLQKYLDHLAANHPKSDWSRNAKMAYWINSYNAFTVKLIVDNYPTSSITNLHGGKPWDVKWIKLGDKTYSLNNIENDILRPKYKDARIHFAVNCAAKSCPPLLNRAWTADNLNSYFERQAKAFVNNASFNKIDANTIEVSKIFEWYAVDFGDLIDYLNKYSNTKISAGANIKYMEYNWNLNK